MDAGSIIDTGFHELTAILVDQGRDNPDLLNLAKETVRKMLNARSRELQAADHLETEALLRPILLAMTVLPVTERAGLYACIRTVAPCSPSEFSLGQTVTELSRAGFSGILPGRTSKLRRMNFEEILREIFPERDFLLSPWLQRKSLTLVFAESGVGKTWLGQGIAYALASGTSCFDRWKALRPCRVLYFDGEMTGQEIQKRLRTFAETGPQDVDADVVSKNFATVAADFVPETGLPALYSPEGRAAYEQQIKEFEPEVVIIDNLSACWRGPDENKANEWDSFCAWLRKLKAEGYTVICLHHAGKGQITREKGIIRAQYRGSSKIVEPMDISIALIRPDEYEMNEGARFEVHFQKSRSITGVALTPFLVELEKDVGGLLRWKTSEIADSPNDLTRALLESKRPIKELVGITGQSKSTLYRRRKAMEDAGTAL